jgi:flagellar biosynthetic protein FliQ
MADTALQLYVLAMSVTLVLALPVIAAIAATGVIVSLIQTAFGIQDQNVTFAPKVAVVALLMASSGASALSAIVHLLSTALLSLPRLAG